MTETPFPLEKILTASLVEWRMVNPEVELEKYELVGVHKSYYEQIQGAKKAFAAKVPPTAVVVLDYRETVADCAGEKMREHYARYLLSGTALVPKKSQCPSNLD